MAMTLVSTVTVGSGGASSAEFTNIPQTGKDLLILYSLRSNTGTATTDAFEYRYNNNSTANAYQVNQLGATTGVNPNAFSSTANFAGSINGNGTTANTFGNGSIYIANYAGSTQKASSVDNVSENNSSSGAERSITANNWNNTAAITSVNFIPNNGFGQHSTFSLYIIS